MKGLRSSGWEGEAADAAFRSFEDIQYQIDAAGKEADSIHGLLSGCLRALRSAKKQLDAIAEAVGGHEHLSLNHHDGSVYIDPDKVESEHLATLGKAYQDTIRDYRRRRYEALETAEDADSTASWALKDLAGYTLGFNNGAYTSLRDAKESRARQGNGGTVSLKELSDGQARSELNSAPTAIQFLSLRPLIAGGDQALHGSPWQGMQTATGAAPSYLAGKSSGYVEKNWKGGPGAGGRHRKPSLINRGGTLGTKVFGWPAAAGATVIDFAYTPELDPEEKIAKSRVMAPGPLNSKVR